jgi:hypothetical protein
LNVPFSGSDAPIQRDRSHSHGNQKAREEVDQGQDRREKDGEEEVTPRLRPAVRILRTPVTTAIRLSFPLSLFALIDLLASNRWHRTAGIETLASKRWHRNVGIETLASKRAVAVSGPGRGTGTNFPATVRPCGLAASDLVGKRAGRMGQSQGGEQFQSGNLPPAPPIDYHSAEIHRHFRIMNLLEPVMHKRPLVHRVCPALALALTGALVSIGCQETAAPPKPAANAKAGADADGGHEHHHHGHGEMGPHGGALVAIGEDAAHLEVVLDAATGKVTAYALDGHAENPISIKLEQLELTFTIEHKHPHDEQEPPGQDKPAGAESLPETGTLILLAIEPGADGTSVFAGESADLKGAEEFDAVLSAIQIGEQEFKNVKFSYPEGNEHEHHH